MFTNCCREIVAACIKKCRQEGGLVPSWPYYPSHNSSRVPFQHVNTTDYFPCRQPCESLTLTLVSLTRMLFLLTCIWGHRGDSWIKRVTVSTSAFLTEQIMVKTDIQLMVKIDVCMSKCAYWRSEHPDVSTLVRRGHSTEVKLVRL